jgi:chitin synthase
MSEIVATPSAQQPIILHPAQQAFAPARLAPVDPRRASPRRRASGRRTESAPSTDVRRRVLHAQDTFEPEAWIDREPVLAASAAAIESGFKNVVCITLYNEPFDLLRNSLSALLLSIGARSFAPPLAGTRSCVVIIADGRNRMDAQILRFFAEVGVIDTERSFSALGETIHLSRKRIDEVMSALGVQGGLRGEIDFAICVKNENRGKLHSHALFFQSICPVLGPELCYQLDAGTVIEAGAVSKLVAYMGERPDVGAAASRILTASPRGAASTLSIWQYMDFVMQKAVTWPTEVASGYLSVIPGQFCVFRWSAVSAPSSDGSGERPLDTYLRGLNAIAPLERVMFLAEDRVFGNEIVLARDKSWRIGYCPAAEATTDACETFGELLRQRRRWQNSALAVRLWLWGRLPDYLSRSDKTLFDKARFGASMLWQGLLTASEAMSPAFLVLLLVAATAGLIRPGNVVAGAAIGGALLVSGGLAWLTLTDRPSRWRSTLCLARDASATLTVVSLLALAFHANPAGQAALMTAPVILTAAIIAASMPGQRWSALRHFPVYLLTDRMISFVLYAYALANVHNVSWGTKGLTDDPCGHSVEQRRLRRLRDVIAGSIVVVTTLLVAVGSEYPGVWVKSESSVVEVFTLLFLVVTSVAAAAWLYSGGRSLSAFGRARFGLSPENRPRRPFAARAVARAGAAREA